MGLRLAEALRPPRAGREARRAGRALALALLGALCAGGCARHGGRKQEVVSRDPNVLVAYVACSLVPAMEVAGDRFEAENAGKSVKIEGDEPLKLVARIEKGEAPDVLVCLGEAEIGVLEREGLLDRASRQAIGSMELAIAVPASSAIAIASFRDLASRRVGSVTMPPPGITSLGTDGKEALEREGIWGKLQEKLVLQKAPLAALKMLAEGKADSGVIYDPCPRLALPDEIPPDSVKVAARLPGGEGRALRVYAVAHKRSPNALLGQRFLRLLNSKEMRPALAEAGLPGAGEE